MVKTLTAGANVVKTLNFLNFVKYLRARQGAYHFCGIPQGTFMAEKSCVILAPGGNNLILSNLKSKYQTRLEKLAKDKHSCLLGPLVSYAVISFLNYKWIQ